MSVYARPHLLSSPPRRGNSFRLFLVLRMSVRPIQSYKSANDSPCPEPPGSVGVPPASRKPKTGIRRRDASAPRNCTPVHGPDARPFLEVEVTHVLIPTGKWYNASRRPRLEHGFQPRLVIQPSFAHERDSGVGRAIQGDGIIPNDINRHLLQQRPDNGIILSPCRGQPSSTASTWMGFD
jgi:hypothetical protein